MQYVAIPIVTIRFKVSLHTGRDLTAFLPLAFRCRSCTNSVAKYLKCGFVSAKGKQVRKSESIKFELVPHWAQVTSPCTAQLCMFGGRPRWEELCRCEKRGGSVGGNGGRPHLSAVTTWLKLISFPFPAWVAICGKGQKLGLFLSCLESLLLPSADSGGVCCLLH